MKKIMILLAAVALMATTACNEKPAKDGQTKENATEKAEAKAGAKAETSNVKVTPMEEAQPTEDGKDHIVAEFNTKDYLVKVENLADGTYRVSLNKDGKADQVYETKNCRFQGKAFLMHTEDGKNILIDGVKGQIVIMDKKEIIYRGSKNL